MNEILEDILKIVQEEINLLDDKVSGINLLESIKFNIIPKFSILEEKILKLENLKDNSSTEFNTKNNKIQINFNFNKESKSQLKKEIPYDTLFLVLKGRLTVDFIKEQKIKNKKINIFPLMGMCLSSQTSIELNSLKDTLFIEFINFQINSNIENLEKDTI